MASPPKRAIWPKSFLKLTDWGAWVGLSLSIIAFLFVNLADLAWWVRVIVFLASLILPILIDTGGKYLRVVWQRVKGYDDLYGNLERATLDNHKLQEEFASAYQHLRENFISVLQTFASAGFQVFDVTRMEWGIKSPRLVIACSVQISLGSRFLIMNSSTLDVLGHFKVAEVIKGGCFVQEERIINAVWWGLLHSEMDKYAHPRVFNTVAVLLD